MLLPPKSSVHFALCVFVLLSLTFVVTCFSFGHGELYFDAVFVVEINFKWHERVAFLSGGFVEFFDFVPVEKESAIPAFRVIEIRGLLEGGNGEVHEPSLPFTNHRIAFCKAWVTLS